MSSYFPNRWSISYLNLTKTMKTHKAPTAQNFLKHQDIKQKEPPQKYRLGTINTKLLTGLNRFYKLIRFARVCNHVTDFNARNKCLTAKLLQQGYRYHKLRKTFSKFYRRHYELISKYNVGLKTLVSKGPKYRSQGGYSEIFCIHRRG